MPYHLHSARNTQRVLGLGTGILFGFLLQKGGVTDYEVIMGPLRLTDFTVVKVMMSAVITGMVGVHGLRVLGMVRLHPKPGSWGSVVPGGLLFGVGFGLLGYCPGTMAGAAGEGRLDALTGGITGVLLGAWLFALLYPRLQKTLLNRGDFGEMTFPTLLGTDPWKVLLPAAVILTGFLFLLDGARL